MPDYWAAAAARERRAQQLRRPALRLLPRRHRRARGLQGGRLRLSPGELRQELGHGLRLPRAPAGLREEGADRQRGPDGHAGVRLQHAAAVLRGPARAARPRLRLRLRVDEPAPLLRLLHADEELLLELRAGRARAARARRARHPRALPRPRARCGVHPGLRAAHHGRLRTHPRQHRHRPRPARARRAGRCAISRLVHAATGQPMRFEILLNEQTWERISLPFVKNLERLGVEARLRVVDTPQYQYRTDHFDFDMVVNVWAQSLSPGNEQRNYWGSRAAAEPGSDNVVGHSRPGRRRADRPRDRLAQTARTSSPARDASTACCCGGTTSSRSGTSGRSASPTGTSSGGPRWRRSTRSASTRGGWTPARAAALPARGQARP